MFPGPPELNPLPGPHRAKTERFAQGALAAFLSACLPVNGFAIVLTCLAYEGNIWISLAAAAAGMVLSSMALMFVCLALFLPSAALAERLTKRMERPGRYLTELGLSILFMLVGCLAVTLLLTQPLFMLGLVYGLILAGVLLPFLLIFWWATRAEPLGYGVRQLLNGANARAQARALFGKPAAESAAL